MVPRGGGETIFERECSIASHLRPHARFGTETAKRRSIFRKSAANENGEPMNRARVTALAACALLMISGVPEARVEPELSAALEPAGDGAFGEPEVARFLRQANPALSNSEVRRTSSAVFRYSHKYGLDPLLVTQVIWVESGARPWVRSPLGAVGLMQVMPHMAAQIGLSGSLASIESNVEAGCWILADNIRRLGEEDGISAYFWGSDIRSVGYLHRVQKARATVRGLSES